MYSRYKSFFVTNSICELIKMLRIILSLIIVFLLLLIVWMCYKKISLHIELNAAAAAIARQKAALATAQQEIANQTIALDKCRGDLTSCQGKTTEVETQIAALKANISDQLGVISDLNIRLDGYQKLVDGYKSTIDKLEKAGMDSKSALDSITDDSRRCNAALSEQAVLVTNLRDIISTQANRIQVLESYTYHLAGPVNDKSQIGLSCGMDQSISILNAQYGGGACGMVDQTTAVASLCNGKNTCSFKVPLIGRKCPADEGRRQSLAVGYRCAATDASTIDDQSRTHNREHNAARAITRV